MRKHRTKLIAAALILVLGAIRMPIEQAFEKDLQELKFRDGTPDLALRDQMPQMAFVAALGGLRSLVASLFDINAYVAFSQNDWGGVDSQYSLICTLQPRFPRYWESASWHMAYNARSYYMHPQKSGDQFRQAVRNEIVDTYTQKGIAYLERGLTFLPDDDRLHLALAQTIRQKAPNPPRAAKHFKRAFDLTGRLHLQRAYAYQLVEFVEPEANQEAYDILTSQLELIPGSIPESLIRDIRILEERLQIPFALRARIPTPVAPE